MQARFSRFCTAPVILMMAVFLFVPPSQLAFAQTAEESELINVINKLRANQGLAPYTVDPALMVLAEEHSAFQASIHESTHLHSDGRTPPQIGVVENVAGGDLGWITPQTAVYDIWNMDYGHRRTMTGFASGAMGVGIADDGTTAYYTLEVIPGEKAPTETHKTNSPAATPVKGGGTPTPYTPIPIVSLVTMTPLPDGTIIHVVGYGQTLWSIATAYGVTVDQIRAWNNLPQGSSDIYAGQKLLVRPLSLVTIIPDTGRNVETAAPAVVESLMVRASPEATMIPAVASTETEASTKETSLVNVQVTKVEAADKNASEPSDDILLPLIAGISILLGGMLLVLVLLRKKAR